MSNFNYDEFLKVREREFKKDKEKLTFPLKGDKKYYYARQCARFEKNLEKYGYDSIATKKDIKIEGLLFNKNSITLGHMHGYDLKRFEDKDEMLGFVVGYNEAVYNFESNILE